MTPPPAPRRSLRSILLAPLLLLLSLFLFVMALVLTSQNQRIVAEQTEHQAQTILEAIQGALEVSRSNDELQRQVTVIGGERRIRNISVALASPTRIIASTRHAWLGKNLDDIPQQEELKALRQVLREGSHVSTALEDPPGHQFAGQITLTNMGNATGEPIRAAVSVVLDTSALQAQLWAGIRTLLIITAVVVILGGLLGWWLLNRRVIVPLEAMAQAVGRRARGDDGTRLPVCSEDEIGMLGRALNTLLDAEARTQYRTMQEQNTARALFSLHAAAPDLDERQVLEQALNLAVNLTQSYGGSIAVCPPGTHTLEKVIQQGQDESGQGFDIFEGDTLSLRLELGGPEGHLDENEQQQARALAQEAWLIVQRKRMNKALSDANNRFRRIIETTLEGVWIFDANLRVTYANQRTLDIFGVSLEAMLGRPVNDFIPDLEAPDHERQMALRRQGKGTIYERRFRRSDGTLVWCQVSATSLMDDGQHFSGSFAMLSDISRIKQTEAELRLAAHVYNDSPNAIAITDNQFIIKSINQAFTEITGFNAAETLDKPAFFVTDEHREQWQQLAPGECWKGEVWNRRKSGERYPEWLSLTPVTDTNGHISHYVAIMADLTERKEAESRIDYLSNHDPLTGLPNRLLFQSRMEQALGMAADRGCQAALVMLNLDRFKIINDSLGHTVGDAILSQAAKRLERTMGQGDVLSRQGGDEFLLLLSQVDDTAHVTQQVQRLLATLATPFHLDDQDIQISGSLGLALYPYDGTRLEDLMPRADSAMRQAKENGRNTFCFYQAEMNSDALSRLHMENALREALNHHQFCLHYQPLVNAESGQVMGVEALIRWPRADGMVSPAQFIPLAEESGLIVPLGAWVLNEACRQARLWQDQGLRLHVAVNLSTVQFKRGDLVATVKEALEKSALDPELLELELTESILIQDAAETMETVAQLRQLGLQLSIDDFGTGYSSLAYLRRLPVQKLKIDQSFVRQLPANPEDAAIVSTIIAMARQLNLNTVAEGVETQAQFEWLRARGCTTIQGYYFSRPLPAAEIPAQIERIRP